MTIPREPLVHVAATPGALRRHRSPARVREVLDALGRRQRELPAWVLAEVTGDDPRVRECDARLAAAERALLECRLPSLHAAPAPRAVVHLGTSAPVPASDALPDALLAGAAVDRVVVADIAPASAGRLAAALRTRHPALAIEALVTDPTIDLALPRTLPRPRLHLCPANGLGRFGTVGAIRLLRVVRATMTAGDRLALFLDLRRDRATLEDEAHDAGGVLESRHRRALALAAREIGADVDVDDFAWRVVWDDEAHRLDTHLVARRALRIALPCADALELRRGESIRTSVAARFDRARLGSMLSGVGLRLAEWSTDAAARCALAVATPA